MGNQLAASGAASTVNIADVSTQLQYVSSLGGKRRGRLFTSMHCMRNIDLPGVPAVDVVVKVFVRNPDDKVQAQHIAKHAEALSVMENKFDVNFRRNQDAACNVLFYQELDRKNERYCKLQRPFVHYSLLDRLHVRPYLSPDEKLFACYQLLCALAQLHDQFQCVHGDLKPENVLITGRGWVYITDMSPYKPTALPCDNPADFEFYFDTAETRNCCIAPEKFYEASATREEIAAMKHTPQNDVFSAGCVIAHVFTGEALFRLATLLEFRAKTSVAEKEVMLRARLAPFALPAGTLQLLCDMLCPGPEQRLSAAKLLEKYIPSVFPPFFPFLHMNVLPPVLRRPPDAVLHFLWSRFDDLLLAVDRCAVDSSFAQRIASVPHNPQRQRAPAAHQHPPQSQHQDAGADLAPSLSMSLGPSASMAFGPSTSSVFPPPPPVHDAHAYDGPLPEHRPHRSLALSLLLPAVCSALRHCMTAEARMKGLHILRRSAACSTSDVTKRDVLLPFALFCAKDTTHGHLARATAIETLAAVCSELSKVCPTGESTMFEDLVLPVVYDAVKEGVPVVTLSVARVLPSVLRMAVEYLQKRQVHHSGGATWLSGYDFQLFSIINTGWECLKGLIKQPDSMVKIAILRQVPAIVRLIGEERATDELVPMLTTMVNEPSIEAKRELLRQAILCHLELKSPRLHFLAFFIDEGLRQDDIACIANTIQALTLLVQARKLPVESAVQLVHHAVPQIAHPSRFVYDAARTLVEMASTVFSPCDMLLHLEPAIRPFLTHCVPLSSLTKHPNVVRKDISFSTGIDGVAATVYKVCSEYADLFPSGSPAKIVVPPNKSRERTFADIIIDVSHVDVGYPRNVEQNAALVLWPMSFKPNPRQMKRMSRRAVSGLQPGSFAAAGSAERPISMLGHANGGANTSTGSGAAAASVAAYSPRIVIPYGMNVAAVGSISGSLSGGAGSLSGGAVLPGSIATSRNFGNRTRSVMPAPDAFGSFSSKQHLESVSNFSTAGVPYTLYNNYNSSIGGSSGSSQPHHVSLSTLRPTAAAMATSKEHAGPIYAMCSARGVLVSGGAKGVVKVWELADSSGGTGGGGAGGGGSNGGTTSGAGAFGAFGTQAVTRLVPVTVKDAVASESTVLSMEVLREGHGGQDMVVGMGVSDGSARFMEPESGTVSRWVQLTDEGVAVTCSQRVSADVMCFGTSAGEVKAVDVRCGERNGVVWQTTLPARDSAITCMTSVATKDLTHGSPALACGTVAGVVALFDLRIRAALQRIDTSLGLPASASNHSSSIISQSGRGSGEGVGKGFSHIRSQPCAILAMAVDPSFCCTASSSQLAPAVLVSTAAKTLARYDLITGAKTLVLEPETPCETRALLMIPRTMCVFSAGSDHRVRVWDFSQPANSYSLFCPPQASPKYSLERPTGAPAAIREAKLERTLHMQHDEAVTCMAVAQVRSKHHLVTAARDGSLTIWHNFIQPLTAAK